MHALIKKGITGLWRGILIDERGKISLSRLQMVLWTVIVLSALLTIAITNLEKPHAIGDPVGISIPESLLGLLGISSTALIGSPFIRWVKKSDTPDPQQAAQTFSTLAQRGKDVSQMFVAGRIVQNSNPAQAQWSDLFAGEEVGNAATLDLGKGQMFYFTLIAAGAYAAALLGMLGGSDLVIKDLPDLSQGVVAFLALSNAAYLVNKAVPHSQAPGTTVVPAVPDHVLGSADSGTSA